MRLHRNVSSAMSSSITTSASLAWHHQHHPGARCGQCWHWPAFSERGLSLLEPACRGFQFRSLDTKYARVLRKSHPGSRLALLTDMDTHFDFDGVDDIEVSTQLASTAIIT